jgi:hypothetical protein
MSTQPVAVPDIAVDSVAQPTNQQLYGIQAKLVIANEQGAGYDLSAMHLKFRVQSRTIQTLKSAEITILNLSPATMATLFNSQEFTVVTLSAGYVNGPFGNLFTGKISYSKKGNLDATTSYLTIIATDSDDAYNWATIECPLAAGTTLQQQLAQVLKVLQPYGITAGSIPTLPANPLVRGKVLSGMVRNVLSDLARTVNCDWHFANGQLNFVSRNVPLSGDVITLTPQTGLIGAPEQTLDGLNVRALLNPNLITGRLIQVFSSQINSSAVGTAAQPDYSPAYLPDLSSNGVYMIYSLTHVGDTRGTGNDWVSEIVAVASSTTSPPLSSLYLNSWI